MKSISLYTAQAVAAVCTKICLIRFWWPQNKHVLILLLHIHLYVVCVLYFCWYILDLKYCLWGFFKVCYLCVHINYIPDIFTFIFVIRTSLSGLRLLDDILFIISASWENLTSIKSLQWFCCFPNSELIKILKTLKTY